MLARGEEGLDGTKADIERMGDEVLCIPTDVSDYDQVEADMRIEDTAESDYDFLVVPGGRAPESLRTDAPETAELIAAFDAANKPIASVCHGAQLLISADVLDGRAATAYWPLAIDLENAGATFRDQEVVVDDNLVTSRYPDDMPAFMHELLGLLEEVSIEATA